MQTETCVALSAIQDYALRNRYGNSHVLKASRDIGTSIVFALAITVLPFLAVAPVLTGALIVHDHGGGAHVHRFGSLEGVSTAHHAAHHDHDSDHLHHDGHKQPSPAPPGRDDAPGIILVIPRIIIASVPSSLHAVSLAVPLPQPISLPVAATFLPELRSRVVSRDLWRAPPTRGISALLLSSHAVLI